jgi:hypothetical protein
MIPRTWGEYLKIKLNKSVIATENKKQRSKNVTIPPKINIPFPIGLIVVVNIVIQRIMITNKLANPHIHTFLGMDGKNNAHLFDKYIITLAIRRVLLLKRL